MTASDNLYSELKPDIAAVANPLFEFSVLCLKNRGNFLPHGAILTEQGEMRLVAAGPDGDKDLCNSVEILPRLHGALRLEATRMSLNAVGVAENVTITLPDSRPTQAIEFTIFISRIPVEPTTFDPWSKIVISSWCFSEPGNSLAVVFQHFLTRVEALTSKTFIKWQYDNMAEDENWHTPKNK